MELRMPTVSSSQEQPTEPIIDLTLTGPDRRAAVRHVCRQRHPCRYLVRPTMQPLPAFVHDVSATGLGLILPQPIAPGTALMLHLPGRRRGISCVHSARVVHVRPYGGGWLAGCRLTQPLTEAGQSCLA
jgi:hypothetical protein